MIQLINLSKSYKTNKVLQNITALFRPLEINGLVGKNGAGKSTLFRCIAGLESYDGTIQFSDESQRKNIGFLPTVPYLMSKITGKEYIQLMCNARKVKIDSIEEKNIFELPLHEYAENYSTGMKKKLAITALLLQKNEIFLLDEPFNGLDLESNMMVGQIIEQLKLKAKTIVISSHMLENLYSICDNLSYLNEGIIIQDRGKTHFENVKKDMSLHNFGDRVKEVLDN